MGLEYKHKARIIERQNNKCAKCQQEKILNIHHIIFKSCGGTDRKDNLVALCSECHDSIHALCSMLPHYKVHQLQRDLLNFNRKRYLKLPQERPSIKCKIIQYY